METTKTHRSLLIEDLKTSINELASLKACRDKGGADAELFDVSVWLMEARIELIEQALKDGELANY